MLVDTQKETPQGVVWWDQAQICLVNTRVWSDNRMLLAFYSWITVILSASHYHISLGVVLERVHQIKSGHRGFYWDPFQLMNGVLASILNENPPL